MNEAIDSAQEGSRGTVDVSSSGEEHDRPVSILALSAVILRHVRLLVAGPALFGLITLGWSVLAGGSYTAYSSFMPQAATGSALAQYADLAAQLGMRIPRSATGESSDFYARLVTTPALLESAANTRYVFATDEAMTDTVAGTLFDIFDVDGDTYEERLIRMLDVLEERVGVNVDARTGVISVQTTTPWPELSTALNRRLLELVEEFNLNTRQSRAAAERRFIEERIASVRADLEDAEEELQAFLERNRTYSASPQLAFQESRLQRRVDLYQQIYISLAQALENARIEEVRNTPVITVIDDPEGLVARDGGLFRNLVVASAGGLFLALGVIFLAEFASHQRSEFPRDYNSFIEARDRAVRGLVPVWLRRVRSVRR